MALDLQNLDNVGVREAMLQQLQQDIDNGSVYESTRIARANQPIWLEILIEAIESHDDDWLADEVARRGILLQTEYTSRGARSVPHNANETLSEGEFNHYYIRGLCSYIVNNGGGLVEVYRARESTNPRIESERMIGRHFDAQVVLDSLSTDRFDGFLQLPTGPNSGLSARAV